MTSTVHTNHPTAELVRRGYRAFALGDFELVRTLLAPDILWHVPGRGPLSGEHRGQEQVLGFLARAMELSAGTFRIQVEDVLADRGRAAVLCTVAAERYGQYWSAPEVHLWRIAQGKGVECLAFQSDQQTEDEFWSA
jgi:ketosteroid isomerase-like protein